MSVRYTPGQLRGAAGVSSETYRHWKKALAPLRRYRGHSPCFTLGDLLAVAVVRALSDLGIRVGALTEIAEQLFALCSAAWPTLERGRLVVNLQGSKVEFLSELSEQIIDGLVVIVPLRP